MARLSQQAENDYVGLSCGIMDQYAAAAALEGTALLLDCRSLEARPVPVPDHAMVVVMDTGSRRGLAFSTYNERRASCETAVRALSVLRPGLRALRDVDEALLQAGRERLDDDHLRAGRPRRGGEPEAAGHGQGLRDRRSRNRGTAHGRLPRRACATSTRSLRRSSTS